MFDEFVLEIWGPNEEFYKSLGICCKEGGLLTTESTSEITREFLLRPSRFPIYRAIICQSNNLPNVIIVGNINMTKQNSCSEPNGNKMFFLHLYVVQSLRIIENKRSLISGEQTKKRILND